MYISKGTVISPSTEELLFVSRCGVKYQLTGLEAALWLDGRFGFAQEKTDEQRRCLTHLQKMGLVETAETQSDADKYWILTQCVLCPAAPKFFQRRLSKDEKELLTWITKAGLHLTVAELVYLNEHSISPVKELLYSYNRQKLVETIYLKNTIQDNVLEAQMEKSPARDATVRTILNLVRKKKILLL